MFYNSSISILVSPSLSFAEGKSDKEILDQLLTNSRYDKRLLPPVEGEVLISPLNVRISA